MFCLARLLLLSSIPASVLAEVRSYDLTIHKGEAAPDGFSRPVYLVNGQHPGPLIEANEDDTLQVFVQNDLTVETTIHWHGLLQRGTPNMDGVPGVTQYPIAPGGNFTYRFNLTNEYGFYWYHSHFRAYYNDAIRGSLNIHPKPSRARPFESLATSDADTAALLQAERDAFPVLLTDWYHESSDKVLAEYNRTGAYPHCVDSLLANGKGRVQCLPQALLDCGPNLCSGSDGSSSMSMDSSNTTPSSMASDTSMSMSVPTSSRAEMLMPSSAASMHMASGMADGPSMTMEMQISAPTSSNGHQMQQRKRQMMDMSSMMTSLGPRGCTPPMMFRPGFSASDIPSETCTDSKSALLTIPGNDTSGWLALNLVNAGSTSKLTVSLDSHKMNVYAADGLFVKMQEVEVLPIGLGERYSVMIKLNQTPGNYTLRFASTPVGDMQQVMEGVATVSYTSGVDNSSMSAMHSASGMRKDQIMPMLGDQNQGVYMLVNGSARPMASSLRPQNLAPFDALAPPVHNSVTTKVLNINQTGIVSWVVDKYSYSEAKVPVIYGDSSNGWRADTTVFMPFNTTVDLIMKVSPDSMDVMGHPMHLHGHKFWVLGSGKGDFPYSEVRDVPSSMMNLENPPYRDTVELPASGWAVIRYISDNPGAWLLHCHIQWHLMSGMALVLVEGEESLPALVNAAGNTANDSSSSSTTAAQTGSGAHAASIGHQFLQAVLAIVLFASLL